jgi:hypothetical protein
MFYIRCALQAQDDNVCGCRIDDPVFGNPCSGVLAALSSVYCFLLAGVQQSQEALYNTMLRLPSISFAPWCLKKTHL